MVIWLEWTFKDSVRPFNCPEPKLTKESYIHSLTDHRKGSQGGGKNVECVASVVRIFASVKEYKPVTEQKRKHQYY